MNLCFGPPVSGDRIIRAGARSQISGFIFGAVVLAACGSGSGPSAGQPTQAPSPAESSSAPASETPSASASASFLASASGITGTFAIAGLAPVIDKPAQTVDTSTFTTSFVSETPAIYVLYKLSSGASGNVVSRWTKGDLVANTLSLEYPASAPWAYFVLTNKDGFVPGDDYEVELTLVDSGATATLPFSVTGPRKAPPSPTPVPSGTTAFTLTTMATFADSSKPAPDASMFTDVFPTTAAELYVVFALRPDLTGEVVCTMTANGADVVNPIKLQYGTGNSWGDFEIHSPGSFPIGDYVARLTFSPSGEVVDIPFTVQ